MIIISFLALSLFGCGFKAPPYYKASSSAGKGVNVNP